MSTKFRIILIGFIAIGLFSVIYEKTYLTENTTTIAKHAAKPSKDSNAVSKQMLAGNTSTPENKSINNSSVSKKHLEPIAQSMFELSDDSSLDDEVLALNHQKSTADLETPLPLWEQGELENPLEEDSIEHQEPIKSNPQVLASLQVGQAVDFFVPQLGETLQSVVRSTSNQYGDVKVWEGDIQGEEAKKSNFVMTQGEKMTLVVLSTSEGVFTASIDNETGEGSIVDDREYTNNMSDTDDAVLYYYDNPQKIIPAL